MVTMFSTTLASLTLLGMTCFTLLVLLVMSSFNVALNLFVMADRSISIVTKKEASGSAVL